MNFIGMESPQKLRGGYYTPLDLAAFLAQWVRCIRPERILEPSCGDGVFFDALANVGGFRNTDVIGFELNPEEAAKSQDRACHAGLVNARVRPEDFLLWALGHMHTPGRLFGGDTQFDAVLGNPPFVRYQYLPLPFQVVAEQIFRNLRVPFTKHTNAWVPFVLASMALLRPGGRLAMVVPAEILHVTHAQGLRSYLGRECRRIVIVDPEEIWFTDTLQGAVILLAEKKLNPAEATEGLGIYPVRGRDFLRLDPEDIFNRVQPINGPTIEGKWTRALLDLQTRNLFQELADHEQVHKFDDVARVDVGIVTGANKFFLVSDDVVKTHDLGRWAHPMFGRSEHCPGIIYDADQHAVNAAKGNPTNFLWLHETQHRMNEGAKEYIKTGEAEKLNTRYKCSVRSPWYTVPSVYATEVGMLKRSHDTPRLILNRIAAYTTDTAYRIRVRGVAPERLVGCFINPLTALSAELESRHYGGGVLEMVPSEIERLIIPLPEGVDIDLAKLDGSIRTGPTHQVLRSQGRLILGALGLPREGQECILEGWRKLRDRRHRTSSEPLAEED